MSASLLRRVVSTHAILTVFGFVVPALAQAQGASVLSGRILDSTGAPIIGASVRVPQLERAVGVDSAGTYRIDGLPAGRVTIVGEAPGFVGKRVEVVVPANGTVEQAFSLIPNAHLLAKVEVRARAHQQLPLKLAEFEMRRGRGGGRFMGPDDVAKFNGQPLTDALKTLMLGALFRRNNSGALTIISSRSLNPSSLRNTTNVKPCGIQIWEDGVLLSDPNASVDMQLPLKSTDRMISTQHLGADHDYDVSGLLSNNYMAVEYYTDLASTPPGFRTGTPSCGVLVLWTRVPMKMGQGQ
jgi:hypothetical protein